MKKGLAMRTKAQKAPDAARIRSFRKLVLEHYRLHGRHDLPWRQTHDPYAILVSEVMLQQTQVPRVIGKYAEFLEAFPTVDALAEARLAEVLRAWSGLGYNRRGKFLHDAARAVMRDHGGRMPEEARELERLPGIGPYTARAVCAFAYGAPGAFIETNIRAVFLHHFFPEQEGVHDRELLPLIEASGKGQDPRTWNAALMDYGSYLKQTAGNASRRSAHHAVQKAFKGSLREARGLVLKALREQPRTEGMLAIEARLAPERLEAALAGLAKDGLVRKRGTAWQLAS